MPGRINCHRLRLLHSLHGVRSLPFSMGDGICLAFCIDYSSKIEIEVTNELTNYPRRAWVELHQMPVQLPRVHIVESDAAEL